MDMKYVDRLREGLYEALSGSLELIEQYKRTRLPEPLRGAYSPLDRSVLSEASSDSRKYLIAQDLSKIINSN